MTSSSSFSRDELASLAPWRLPEMGSAPSEEDPTTASPPTTPAPPPAPDSEVLEKIRQEAHEAALKALRAQGHDQGYREGYQEGLEKGEARGREELLRQAEKLAALMNLLNAPLETLDEEVVEELTLLSLAVAKQLVRRELKSDPGQVVAVVRQALAALPNSTRRVSLHLHPEDVELVRSALALEEVPAAWQIVDDPLLTRGGCRVETETSLVDASVEKRFAAAVANLLGDERDGEGP